MARTKEFVNLTDDVEFMEKLKSMDRTTASKVMKAATGNGFEEPTVYDRIIGYFEEQKWKLRFNDWEKMPLYVTDDGVQNDFTDPLEASILTHYERIGIALPKERVRTIILGESQQDTFHPAKEYFNRVNEQYDGVDYISLFCKKYIQHNHEPLVINGIEHDYFVFTMKSWMKLAVGKLFNKRQNFCFTIDGKQDLGKSTFLQWLCPKEEWYNSEKLTSLDKDVRGRTTHIFIWEIPEIDSTTRKTDVSELKDFLTKVWEILRPAYGHYDIKAPVTASYCASLNANESVGFLSDPTGNRRYGMVKVESFDFAYIKEFDVNKLWAQATAEYFANPDWSLPQEFKDYRDSLNSTVYTIKTIEQEHVADYVWVSGDNQHTIFKSDLREALEKTLNKRFNNYDANKINTEIAKKGGTTFFPRVQGKQGREAWRGVKLRWFTVEPEGDKPGYEILKKITPEWIDEQLEDAKKMAVICNSNEGDNTIFGGDR